MSGGTLARLARSKRAPYAVIGNGMVALASFALSISIARASSTAVFGTFSIAMVAYLFSSGLVRAGITDTALSRPDERATFTSSVQRASLVATVGTILLVGWGFASANHFLIVLGVSLHGLITLDFVRTHDSAVGAATRAVVTTVFWSAASVSVSLLSLFLAIDPLGVFAAWALSGAVCGYVVAGVAHVPLFPRWRRNRRDTRAAGAFAADYLVGSGGSLLTTGLLGLLDDIRIVGALRGGGTLLGPMNLISTTARSLMLPFLARRQVDPGAQFQSAIRVTAAQVLVLVPLLAALQFIPDPWGRQLLGDTWQLASLVLLPLSIESVFALVSAAAAAGHRVAFAGRRTLILRAALGLPRPVVVLLSSQAWGVAGAAWSMVAISVLNAVVWWVSYIDLTKASRTLGENSVDGAPRASQSRNFDQERVDE